MGLFDHIESNVGGPAIAEGFKAVLSRANTKRIYPNWSMAELDLDEKDYRWLLEWAKELDRKTAFSWLCPENHGQAEKAASYRAAVGILLYLVIAEYSRRRSSQQSEMISVGEVLFSPDVGSLLFSGHDPHKVLLRAIEEASLKSKLRWFDHGDTGNYLQHNLRLHTGFIPEDFGRALREWLKGNQLPDWLKTLLDAKTGSDSFRKTWQAFVEYLSGALNEATLRGQLKSNPWILNEQINQLVDCLKPIRVDVTPLSVSAHSSADGKGVFSGIAPNSGEESLQAAVARLIVRAGDRVNRQLPWSLAELKLSESDYTWLRVWVGSLTIALASQWKEPWRRFSIGSETLSYRSAFGCLLMLWISEEARRYASEQHLWAKIPKQCLQHKVRTLLFAQEQPRQLLKELLEEAARHFNLRHVFGIEGMQNWFDTILLQIGITQYGVKRRLPEWLVRQGQTLAVRHLLNSRTGSRSFQHLWNSLREYRRNQISEKRLRSIIEDSPWVLKDWSDALVEAAQKSLRLDEIEGEEEDSPPASLLSEPLLRWDGVSAPYFLCAGVHPDALELTDDRYELTVNGRRAALLLQQPDGDYRCDPEGGVALSLEAPEASIAVKSDDGGIIARATIDLWAVDEEVVVFRLSSGECVADPYTEPMSTTSEYAVIASSDLEMVPHPGTWRVIGDGSRKLYFLPRNWPADTRLLLDGDVLWEPMHRQNAKRQDPAWTQGVQIYLPNQRDNVERRWGRNFQAVIRHPKDVAVRFVRSGGVPVEFANSSEERITVGPLRCGPESSPSQLAFQIGLQYGSERRAVRRLVESDVIGAAVMRDGVWKVFSGYDEISVSEARTRMFRIQPPRTWDKRPAERRDWLIKEGEVWVRRLWRGDSVIGDLSGWGAPLVVRYGAYNNPDDALVLARSVIDRGIINRAVVFERGDSRRGVCIRLNRSLEPDSQHSVIWWDRTGELWRLTVSESVIEDESGCRWICDLPDEATDYLAVAVAYDGERLGSVWAIDWAEALHKLSCTDIALIAALIRWFQLPILDSKSIEIVRAWVFARAADVWRAWLDEDGLLDFLMDDGRDQGWQSALRTLVQTFEPDSEFLAGMLEVEAEPVIDLIRRRLWQLSSLDPVLMGKALTAWIQNRPRREVVFVKNTLKEIRRQLAESEDDHAYSSRAAYLLDQAAQTLRADSSFLQRSIIDRSIKSIGGASLADRDYKNLAQAMSVDPLRRLLACRVLEFLEAK